MRTTTVLKHKAVDRVVWISPKDIVTNNLWIPGDFDYPYCSCRDYFHICDTPRSKMFEIVLDNARQDSYYDELYTEIELKGFKAPLGAQMTKNYDLIHLVDGHHRLAVALDLKLKTLPVYIANPDVKIYDICAMDTRYWQPGTVHSPFVKALDKAA